MKRQNSRRSTLLFLGVTVFLLLFLVIIGLGVEEEATVTDFTRTNLAPSLRYLFGTDWMGRDMFLRTLAGLSLSIRIGLLTAGVSAVVALLLGVAAATLGPRNRVMTSGSSGIRLFLSSIWSWGSRTSCW